MQGYIIAEIDNNIDNIAQEFIRKIKVAVINLKTLHRNLKGSGSDWFETHELLDEYTSKLNEVEDKIVENLIGLGIKDKSIKGSEDILDVKDYTEEEALNYVYNLFEELLQMSINVREEVSIPTAVAPVFDEFENMLHIEANYKLAQALNK